MKQSGAGLISGLNPLEPGRDLDYLSKKCESVGFKAQIKKKLYQIQKVSDVMKSVLSVY